MFYHFTLRQNWLKMIKRYLSVTKRFARYIFFISIILWIIISIQIAYKYVWKFSKDVNTKWWTFVEWIFENTSYLPYLRDDSQGQFYQGLLFNWCIEYSYNSGSKNWDITQNMCKVRSDDSKSYTIKINPGLIRSDGTPMTNEDIFFTYNEIIKENKWNLDWLKWYSDIKISRDEAGKVVVEFPSKSQDNILFFLNYILPKHILANYTLDDYKNFFWTQPVYTNCANLMSQTKDPHSLIFNLVNCENSYLNFYQIKNTLSFDELKRTIEMWNWSIIDVYEGPNLKWYDKIPIQTNKLATIFFNTHSNKLSTRTRRVLWWLIKHNFYTWEYNTYVQKNDDKIFDHFLSTGTNIKEFLSRSTSEWEFTKEELIEIQVKPIPKQISLNSEWEKFVYFTENSWQTLEISLNTKYSKIIADINGKAINTNYNAKDNKLIFWISEKDRSLLTWLNKYSIYGYNKNNKIKLASLDLYYIKETKETEWTINKLKVIYFNNETYSFIAKQLKTIFEKADIIQYFEFIPLETPEEVEWSLNMWDYDILISAINLWLQKDLSKIFITDKANINPSQYQNLKINTLFNQYLDKKNTNTLSQMNEIISKDMPIVILWKSISSINIKPNIAQNLGLSSTWTNNLNEFNRRKNIYHNIHLVKNIHVDGKAIWNLKNFYNFLYQNIKWENLNKQWSWSTPLK